MRFTEVEKYRVSGRDKGKWSSDHGDLFGAFEIPGPGHSRLRIIASDARDEMPWEHVSVSLPNRTPNWKEMCFIKELFWDDEETVMQLHPPRSEWINNHPYCLHLWKPRGVEIPRPSSVAVGYKELNLSEAK